MKRLKPKTKLMKTKTRMTNIRIIYLTLSYETKKIQSGRRIQ